MLTNIRRATARGNSERGAIMVAFLFRMALRVWQIVPQLIKRGTAAKPSNPVYRRYVQRRYALPSNPVQQRYVLTSNPVQGDMSCHPTLCSNDMPYYPNGNAARAYPPLAPTALSRLMNSRSAFTHAARSAGVSKSMANPPLSHTAYGIPSTSALALWRLKLRLLSSGLNPDPRGISATHHQPARGQKYPQFQRHQFPP